MHLAIAVAFLLQSAAPDTAALRAARSPAFSPDGRLAVSSEGDLFVQLSAGASWTRVTRGLGWDRDPVWTKDGSAIVFSSDRAGNFDLWRVRVAADGSAGEPERLTSTPESESAPSVSGDGGIAFVRGTGTAARIWIRSPDGAEKRLETREQIQLAPAWSPDGTRLAYVLAGETGRRLVVRTFASGRETTVNADRNPDRVAWAPAGDRLAFSGGAAAGALAGGGFGGGRGGGAPGAGGLGAAGGTGGVFVAPPDGRWTNLAATRRGDLAWSPDGKTIAIAEYQQSATGYNGDPDRLGERIAAERFGRSDDKLYFVAAPPSPDAGLAEQPLAAPLDRAARNADAYDRVWERSTKLYFSSSDAADRRAEWERAKAKHRDEALAAKDDEELQRAIHAMLRERPPLKASATGRAAVSSAHPVATEAGLEILRAGGNVVDAAVAVSFALGVVEPDASGIGGYGQMVILLSKLEKPALIEFMTRVPEDAGLSNTALLVNGRYPGDGPVLANVPGTVAGMHAAWKKYGSGKMPWKDLLAPAIRAARDGYVVSDGLATTLSVEREGFLKYDGSRALFFRNGQPLHEGDTLRNPDLAWVLEKIADGGADGFYRGEVARKLVDDLHAKGNAMKLADLSRYYAPEREPVSGTYRGYSFYSSTPPVAGGADLAAKLNLFEHFEKPRLYTEDAATLHAALSAWLLVPGGRGGRVADPGLWAVDIGAYVSKDTARTRWTACFRGDRALRPAEIRGDSLRCGTAAATTSAPVPATPPPNADEGAAPSPFTIRPSPSTGCEEYAAEASTCRAQGTTSFAVADNDGNAVAVTQTLGTWGGNFYVTPGLGFLYNDKLTSYGTDPAAYGARLPFARHGSTLAPTIVLKGKRPVLAVGAAGNAWIASAVYETILGVLDFGLDPQRALELPRFLPGGGGGRGGGAGGAAAASAPFSVQMEDGFSPDVIKRLREMGYEISFISMRGELRQGYGAAVAINGKRATAGADPRRAGAAGAIP